MAWKLRETPCCMIGCAGVMAMLAMAADVMVMAAFPVTPWKVAVTVTVPAFRPVTFSFDVALSSKSVASVLSDEAHVACAVMSCLVPSKKTAVAVMAMDCPTEISVTPSMLMLWGNDIVTVTLAVAVSPEYSTLMLVRPAFCPVTVCPETCTMVESPEVKDDWEVTSDVVPSEKTAVTTNPL